MQLPVIDPSAAASVLQGYHRSNRRKVPGSCSMHQASQLLVAASARGTYHSEMVGAGLRQEHWKRRGAATTTVTRQPPPAARKLNTGEQQQPHPAGSSSSSCC